VSKKTEKPIKPRKLEKNNRKNWIEKKLIKPIKILKKQAGSVRFRFYKQKTEKTEPKPKKPEKNWSKPSQNWAKPVWTYFFPKNKPNLTETGRFNPISVRFWFFLKKIQFGYFFFDKKRTKPKMITPSVLYAEKRVAMNL